MLPHDLPVGDSKRPDVGFLIKSLGDEALGRHVAHGQAAGPIHAPVVQVSLHEPRQSKVPDLHQVVLRDEDVSSCNITMDNSFLLEGLRENLEKYISLASAK